MVMAVNSDSRCLLEHGGVVWAVSFLPCPSTAQGGARHWAGASIICPLSRGRTPDRKYTTEAADAIRIRNNIIDLHIGPATMRD